MNNEWNMNWDYERNIDWDINCINMVIHSWEYERDYEL